MSLKHLALATAVLAVSALPGHAADPTPVQVFVLATAKGCETRVRPGTGSLETGFPGTQLFEKHADPESAPFRSCEVWVPRDQLLATFAWCALGSAAQSSCWLSLNLHGGRHVGFTAWSEQGNDAACGFVCMSR